MDNESVSGYPRGRDRHFIYFGGQSYELAAYYYAYQSELQCTESGGKGYFFITGDEAFYPEVIGSQVRQAGGGGIA